VPEIPNSKHQIRNKLQCPKSEIQNGRAPSVAFEKRTATRASVVVICALDFEFVSDFEFDASDFGAAPPSRQQRT
jgi:hypothetical protein